MFSSALKYISLTLLMLLTSPSFAQTDIDQHSVEVWADELFGDAATKKQFSGDEMVVVKNGELILSKAYGYADITF